MAYDQRIIDIARIAAKAAGKNARVPAQLLSADIIFTLADAVEDGRLILGEPRDSDGSPQERDRNGLDGEAATARAEGIAQTPSGETP